jgi:F0F1-type ATP synthase epsilon subunit
MKPTNELRVVLRTPTELLLDTNVCELEAADLAGRFVVRADCEPVLTALVPGDIVMRSGDGRELRAAVGFGSCIKVGREVRLVVEHADLGALQRMPLAV